MTREVLRIGNCSGFFGDRQSAAREMLAGADIDVLTGDWLAELTMLILMRQRERDPLRGFAATFVSQMEEVLGTCVDRGIKVVSNAGGMNPVACAAAVTGVAERLGIPLSMGVVSGDDILDDAQDLVEAGRLVSLEGETIGDCDSIIAANAYLGGWGIVGCLKAGADVVVTGRVSDASLVVGPSAWAFNWAVDDWDRLAGAVIAGHVIECGAQATGGNFSFFTELGDMRRIGFPIAEIRPDGSSVITKPAGSNGSVTAETVTAQLLYEVGSPAYLNPDVIAHLDSVFVTLTARDRVELSAARGSAPPARLKVSMAKPGGFRNEMTMVLTGPDIDAKAAVAEELIWDLIPGGRAAFREVHVELIGGAVADAGTLGGAMRLLRIAVSGQDADLVGRTFSSAVIQSGLSSYPGFFMTSPPTSASAFDTYIPGLVAATAVPHMALVDGEVVDVREPTRGKLVDVPMAPQTVRGETAQQATIEAPLGRVCGGRSGDKGGDANVGLWVRQQAHYKWLVESITVDLIQDLLPRGRDFHVERFELANLGAVNFLIHGWLGDGVASCLRFDSQAKGLAEYLRARHVQVPEWMVA